jgi:hypothetical protein
MRMILAILIALVTAGYLSFLLLFPIYTHRYRLSIDIDVAGVTHAGSSVIEVRWQVWPEALACLFGCTFGDSRVYGQAVLVNLGTQGVILAALWPANTTQPGQAVPANFLAIRAFGSDPLPATGRDIFKMSTARGTATLRANNLPQFIWLKDATDPATAKPLLAADFPTELGGNVRLQRASIEITTDPITTGLEAKLPWLTAMRERQLKRGVLSAPGQFSLATDALLGSP